MTHIAEEPLTFFDHLTDAPRHLVECLRDLANLVVSHDGDPRREVALSDRVDAFAQPR